MKRTYLTAAAAVTALTLVGAASASAAGPDRQGPSSSQAPVLAGVQSPTTLTSILTTGDTVGGYTFAGIPDGLGAFDNGDGTFTVLANHEIPAGSGLSRAHGATGSFISKWTIKNSLQVVKGEDLIKRVKQWDGSAWQTTTTEFSRFCSSDLTEAGAFYDPSSGTGTGSRIYLTGEEAGSEGRATATVVDGADAGTTYVLPWLGRTSFENVVALPNTGAKTIVITLDDSTPGQVYVYIGEKKATGNDVERAGLTGGRLYGVRIDGVTAETDATTIPSQGAGFSLVEIPGAANLTGAQIEAFGKANGITAMNRPEDGAWDPSHRNGFYLATTASFSGLSRLWHLEFDDATDPVKGGVATIRLESPAYDTSRPSADQAGPRMMDNITVSDRGQVLIQEDPGNNAYLAGMFQYDATTGTAERIARFDAARFAAGAPRFVTQDEESSGIIPAPFLGNGAYLLDAQVHKKTDQPATVEQGQLLLLRLAPGKPVR